MIAPIPVTLLTGFLGSGKTTLLRRLLAEEGGQGIAVLINEFGEIGLDHLLVRNVSETAVVLRNGCICCTIRTDIQKGLRDLIDGRSRGDFPPFERIVLETTGLADPVPIVQTLTADPMLSRQVRLASLVTAVDAVHGADQLDRYRESRRQAAVADLLMLTKTDIADAAAVDRLKQRLARLNPNAGLVDTAAQVSLRPALLGPDSFDPAAKSADVQAWLARLPKTSPYADALRHVHAFGHDGDIASFSIRTERPIDWAAFAVWLSALTHRYGPQILRVKGLLDVADARRPVVLNAVRHVVHAPFHLDAWPDEDHASRLVFIVQGLETEKIERSLFSFLDAAAMPAAKRSDPSARHESKVMNHAH